MKISCGRPVGGRRELLCRGDEAVVSKVRGVRGYEGMVERLQLIPSPEKEDLTFNFDVWTTRECISLRIGTGAASHHLLRFVALRFAKSLFPKNFVDCHEMRFFREGDQRYAAMYSDFVPDDNGLVQRRKRYMEAFYAEQDEKLREDIRDRMHLEERTMNPSLAQMIRDLRKVGIVLAHPEANYHLSDDSLVFFEIEGLDIYDASAFSYNDEIQGYLSLFYAISLRHVAYHIAQQSSAHAIIRRAAFEFASWDFGELVRIAHFILYIDIYYREKSMAKIDKAIKKGIGYYLYLKPLWRELLVDAEAIKDVDRIIREDF